MNKIKLLENYLKEDGLERDIVSFANNLDIVVGTQRKITSSKKFIAITLIVDDLRIILLNSEKLGDLQSSKMVLA